VSNGGMNAKTGKTRTRIAMTGASMATTIVSFKKRAAADIEPGRLRRRQR
jgi:hypothetical protein